MVVESINLIELGFGLLSISICAIISGIINFITKTWYLKYIPIALCVFILVFMVIIGYRIPILPHGYEESSLNLLDYIIFSLFINAAWGMVIWLTYDIINLVIKIIRR